MTVDHTPALAKHPTGIGGLDAITGGGLPAGAATLVLGTMGAGKTVLALNIIARAVERGEQAVFVSFEESRQQITRNAVSFRWGPALAAAPDWQIIDARPGAGTAVSGGFDLAGLQAGVGAAVDRLGARWVVLDGIDRLLQLHPDREAATTEIATLETWCEQRGITLLLTGKSSERGSLEPASLPGIEFLLSTVLVLSAELVGRRLNRRLRIAKYRGSAHATDELAMLIDGDGIQLPYDHEPPAPVAASSERLGTGVARLDRVLGGGLYRGSTVLISGAPGTAKTTLAASIAAAAATRGEPVLYVTFDELADRIVRNLAPLGIELQPPIDRGLLRIVSRDAWSALVEEHFIAIEGLLEEQRPSCLVIDPISALLKSASAESAYVATERLLGLARARGVTSCLTSLTGSGTPSRESTLSHTSTLADTWIALEYQVRGGERNRTLSVVKSRGSAHSNQVRELLLCSEGIDLADVYQLGSEVLAGTARVQKESEEAERRRREAVAREQALRELEGRMERAAARVREAQAEQARLRWELERAREEHHRAAQREHEHRAQVMRTRRADEAPEQGREDQ